MANRDNYIFTRFLGLMLCCLALSHVAAQNGCDDCDTSFRKPPPFVKKDYTRFCKDSCDVKKYPDAKEAKELFCRASYYVSIHNFLNAIELLQQAYLKGTSAKFKFQILKLVAESYRGFGDTKAAAVYDEKVRRALQNNPDLDQ